MSDPERFTSETIEPIIRELLGRLAINNTTLYYIDIYPVDPVTLEDGYTYEMTEQPRG